MHKRACNSFAAELAKSRAELNEMKTKMSQNQSTNGNLVLVRLQPELSPLSNIQSLLFQKYSEVEDALNCEICTRRMYTPYLCVSPDNINVMCSPCYEIGYPNVDTFSASPVFMTGLERLTRASCRRTPTGVEMQQTDISHACEPFFDQNISHIPISITRCNNCNSLRPNSHAPLVASEYIDVQWKSMCSSPWCGLSRLLTRRKKQIFHLIGPSLNNMGT